MKKIQIAIAEDHQLVRQGIISLLREEESIHVLFEASNGQELLNHLKTEAPDVILLDLNMPVMSGQETMLQLHKTHPAIKVLIISMHNSDFHVTEMMARGARGFLPKNSDIETVVKAIHAVYSGGYYVDEKVSGALIGAFSGQVPDTADQLSPRELEILKLICLDKSNQEISDTVFLSKRTVEWHKNNILAKTKAKTTVGLMKYALRHGIISDPAQNL